MRLIDVADLEKFIRENVCAIGDDHLLLVAGDDGRWHEALPLVKTAYDIDKVVEDVRCRCYEMGLDESQTEIIAIEIVKAGIRND